MGVGAAGGDCAELRSFRQPACGPECCKRQMLYAPYVICVARQGQPHGVVSCPNRMHHGPHYQCPPCGCMLRTLAGSLLELVLTDVRLAALPPALAAAAATLTRLQLSHNASLAFGAAEGAGLTCSPTSPRCTAWSWSTAPGWPASLPPSLASLD